MNALNRFAPILLLALMEFVTPIAHAGDKPYISSNSDGVAVRGYDPVAYFTLEKPAKGKEEFAATWNGATWYFINEENAAAFKQNPEKYAPQYGGYCAYAVGNNYTFPADPLVWKIVGGKLYLNANQQAQQLWSKDIPGNIKKGDGNWPAVLAQ